MRADDADEAAVARRGSHRERRETTRGERGGGAADGEGRARGDRVTPRSGREGTTDARRRGPSRPGQGLHRDARTERHARGVVASLTARGRRPMDRTRSDDGCERRHGRDAEESPPRGVSRTTTRRSRPRSRGPFRLGWTHVRGDQRRGDEQLRQTRLTPRFPRSGGKRSQPRRRARPRRRRLERSHACVRAIKARRATTRSRRARPVWPRTRVSRAHSWTHATSVSEPEPAARDSRVIPCRGRIRKILESKLLESSESRVAPTFSPGPSGYFL